MSMRYDIIPKAHDSTLTWAFQSQTHPAATKDFPSFRDWLSKEEGIFWVTGKPGSGKSTFLKFAADHSVTQKHLTEWSDGQKLILATPLFHYLWQSDSKVTGRFFAVSSLRHYEGGAGSDTGIEIVTSMIGEP
ncbi:hypothetical protein QBC36DRAFT_370393 [Triangularia setosa]|uniref:Nephrocystin 3-like N-terminal domain-containing protein n=1 Tax=Triangularia setosa TaxID=2587417 RepID=A0AAN7A936_9PEZI|nr:hypothetical protein QBC36DRAFT_370393 [Podospora setosa]